MDFYTPLPTHYQFQPPDANNSQPPDATFSIFQECQSSESDYSHFMEKPIMILYFKT